MQKVRGFGVNWRWAATTALVGMCLLAKDDATQAKSWDAGWPVVALTEPREYDGAGFSVQVAQYLLRQRGFRIKVDGNFGPQSREATRRFQRSRGLKATGAINAATWRRLIVPVKQGSRGDAVRAVQIVLRESDLRLPVDGVFGPATRRALLAFQKDAGIQADGIVGPVTWQKLVGDIYD